MQIFSLHWIMQNLSFLISLRSPFDLTDIKKPNVLHHPMQAKTLHFNHFAVRRCLLCSLRNSVMCTAFADLDFSVNIVLGSMCPNTSVCGASLASLNNKSSVFPAPAKKSVLSAVMIGAVSASSVAIPLGNGAFSLPNSSIMTLIVPSGSPSSFKSFVSIKVYARFVVNSSLVLIFKSLNGADQVMLPMCQS